MAAATARKRADRPVDYSTGIASDKVMAVRQHVDQRFQALKTERYSWWTHWAELAKYILPRRYRWLITPNQGNRGSPINQAIIDSTATEALRTLRSGMLSGMTSPTSTWFRFTIDNQDLSDNPAVKVWLDEVAKRVRTVFSESNFYNALATMYEDLGLFGSAPMLIYDDDDDVIRCYNSCAGEYMLANGPRMDVDTFYREFVLTTSQAADDFGIENCSPSIQQAVRRGGAGMSREVIIAHAIEPNRDYIQGLPGLRGMSHREVYWEWGASKERLLRYRGYYESPFIAPRWDITGNDAYGRSPGMDALGDVKQLQVEQKRKAQGIDKMVNPPLVADVALKNEPASVLPGGVTYVPQVAGGVGFKPVYEVKPDLSHMVEDIKEVQQRIRNIFFEPLFMMWANMEGVQPRNELEIIERKGEKLIQLGPVVERFGGEALDPAIKRTVRIMLRRGLLPKPPPELKGQKVKIEYVSMLAQAQKAAMTTGLEQFMSFVGRLAAADPAVIDNVDTDEVVQQYADYTGISAKLVRPIAKVAKIRAARAQAEAEQKMMEQTMAGVTGAKTLSETKVGGGKNALEMMMGGA